MLPLDTFKSIIKNTPLVSIDLVVYNQKGEVLLGKRNNRPAQGYWFVPGGRILKDESMAEAFKRLTLNELGTEFTILDAQLIGPFDHFYTNNLTGEDFSTHYVALGYRLTIDDELLALPTKQHNDYNWFGVEQLLEHPQVHKHTRWYFEPYAKQTVLRRKFLK
ncbi:GDP-mannose mannosyl hydrolase [Psychromonas sp. psych-6C06]|uniref:GDP-mannose mannosyl hydrolase n=1 Tax=Psychromonas sp. psych-6C06 TaxID=2058089 RepID=UPI000C33CF5E|nr:GDP-mannose mannosyl hydrolase [Psychromonas sp. psych-6C06]PKF63067.1 GDP-mannose mannosyl hydrolase [Psychromonas sp. psych-6C06]